MLPDYTIDNFHLWAHQLEQFCRTCLDPATRPWMKGCNTQAVEQFWAWIEHYAGMVKQMNNHTHRFFILTACLFRSIEVGEKSFRLNGKSGRPSAKNKHNPKPSGTARSWKVPGSVNWRAPIEYEDIKFINLSIIKNNEVRSTSLALLLVDRGLNTKLAVPLSGRMAPAPSLPPSHAALANPLRDALACSHFPAALRNEQNARPAHIAPRI